MDVLERKAYMESFFDREFEDEDFIETEEERMAREREDARFEDFKVQLLALRARAQDEDEYQRLAKQLALRYLHGDE